MACSKKYKKLRDLFQETMAKSHETIEQAKVSHSLSDFLLDTLPGSFQKRSH